ncbi:DUF4222 domain-containing protein [Gibbsiella quercinecans]|uniref:DUF4222 domain-containing protein n=1 Tax=Gibbsiella quercinecans TaxID=929813 RepID=UPI000EF19009|nr:DUF4222 domain-containing protein [Gibbsiella quercinecans]RLM13339.1 DUF4222 domain-containing protein [Gibbsiella quercinecans]
MAEQTMELDRYYRDPHGIVVHVIRYDRVGQRDIYLRPDYEWECVCPLIIFRSRFTRMEA